MALSALVCVEVHGEVFERWVLVVVALVGLVTGSSAWVLRGSTTRSRTYLPGKCYLEKCGNFPHNSQSSGKNANASFFPHLFRDEIKTRAFFSRCGKNLKRITLDISVMQHMFDNTTTRIQNMCACA